MDNSIENIWIQGFKANEPLVVPRVNQLYNQKSQRLVEKMMRALKQESKVIIISAVVIFFFNMLMGNSALSGLPAVLWCVIWFFIVRRQTKHMTALDNNENCYDFLKSFTQRIRKGFRLYEILLWIGTPLLVLPMLIYTYFNYQDKTIGDIIGIDSGASNLYIFLVLPIAMLFSIGLFKLSIRLGYGPMLNKLEELIRDMDVLRNE